MKLNESDKHIEAVVKQLIAASNGNDKDAARKACFEIRAEILKMTPANFAEALGVTRQTVHAWEKEGVIPRRRADQIEKLVKTEKPTKEAELLLPEEVIERMTRCKTVWLIKGATAFQGGVYDAVEKRIESCLDQSEGLKTIKYVFPFFNQLDPKFLIRRNIPLRSYFRLKNRLERTAFAARIEAVPVKDFKDAFLLCMSASPVGLIILEYADPKHGPSRDLIVEVWDQAEKPVLRKLSELHAIEIFEGMTKTLNRLDKTRDEAFRDIEEYLKGKEDEDTELSRKPEPFKYPK